MLEAQNQLEIAELLERKELENIKTEYQEKVKGKLAVSKSKSLESNYSDNIGALNTTAKNKTLQIPSNLFKNFNCQHIQLKQQPKFENPLSWYQKTALIYQY